jgi:hypothetical protein
MSFKKKLRGLFYEISRFFYFSFVYVLKKSIEINPKEDQVFEVTCVDFFAFLYRSKNKYLILAGLSPSHEL